MSNYNMDCNKQYTISATYGNEFNLILRLKSRTFKSSKPIDEDIDATKLENLVVKINNEVWSDVKTDESGVICHIPGDLPVGTYNVELTAIYNGVAIRAAYFECFTRPKWSYESDAENYLPGSPIESEAAYIIGGPLTDEDVEELKAELRLKIAAAEEAKEAYDAAKEEYVEKAEELDGVAQEATSQTILTAVDNIDIDTTTIAKQGTNANATLTATQAAVVDGNDTAVGVGKEVRSEVGTGSDTAAETGTLFAIVKWIKNKVNAITGYALQGSDSTKSITTLDASLGDVEDALDYMEEHIMPEYSNLAKQGSNANANISDIQASIGTPASGQPSDLFAAIAAGGGGGGDAQESTSQAILAAVNSIVNAHIINSVNYDGFVFEDFIPLSVSNLLLNLNKVISLDDYTTRNLDATSTNLPVYNDFKNCNYIRFHALQSITWTNNQLMVGIPVKEIYFPELRELTGSGYYGIINSSNVLRRLSIPKCPTFVFARGCVNLIDVIYGGGVTTNTDVSMWNPTNALKSDSTSLVEQGETFSSNLEKLLYNIREHIAANLPDRTGLSSLTITFSSAVKAAINADATTAAAFTNKNWTIA